MELAQHVQELIISLNTSFNLFLPPQPLTDEIEGGPNCLHSIERLNYIPKTGGGALAPPEVTPIDFEAAVNSEEQTYPTFGATVEIKHVIKMLKRAYLPQERPVPKAKPKGALAAHRLEEGKGTAEGTEESSDTDDGYQYLEH